MYLHEIQKKLGGETVGEVTAPLTSVGTLSGAHAGQITFLANPRYRSELANTGAGAVIVSPKDRDLTALPRIIAANPYAYFARVAQLFNAATPREGSVHALAAVHADAIIAKSAVINEFVSIGCGATIGERVYVGPGTVIGEGAVIGDDTTLAARVTIYAGCRIGARNIIHSGVVIGADGFGFAPDFSADGGEWVKIPQTGIVIIGDDCEFGANTTVDRGAIDNTVIGNGVKIDNQVQIGHNCTIGDHTVIAGCAGVAGSAKVGKRVLIGGAAGIVGHVDVCDGAIISAMTLVSKSITEPGTYTSGMPMMKHHDWLRNAVHLRRLDAFANELKNKQKEGNQG